jgi:hypothetical protein
MRVATHGLWACAKELSARGVDVQEWLRENGLSELDLVRPAVRPEWPAVARAIDHALDRIGPDGLRAAGRRAPSHPIVERISGLIPRTRNTLVPYRIFTLIVSGSLFPVLTMTLRDGALHGAIHDGFDPCEGVFHLLAGALEVTPTFYGQPATPVTLDAGPRSARLLPGDGVSGAELDPNDQALVDSMAIRMLRATTFELDQLRAEKGRR